MLNKYVPDASSIVHFVSGLLSGLLITKAPFFALALTILFSIYQLLDSLEEEISEAKRDIVEFAAGLAAGVVYICL